MSLLSEFTKGFLKENPILVLLIGMCPTLAVSSSAFNGLGMGLAATFVLVCSNVVISLLKNLIPDKVRIPAFIVIIASFVTIVDLSMQAFTPELAESLGVFIPLIVVNCIILARAEAFASKNGVGGSFLDGLGMGIGFAIALTILGGIREIIGDGKFFGIPLFGENPTTVLIFILPPGAFVALGLMIAFVNKFLKKAA